MADEKPIGRPKAEIDWNIVAELCIYGCSGSEIASEFGLNPDTIYARCVEDNGISFSAFSRKFFEKGNNKLRKAQLEKAINGDNTMMVWLGKNRLGQKDNHDVKDIDPQTLEAFKAFMDMMNQAQSSQRNQDDKKSKSDTKS